MKPAAVPELPPDVAPDVAEVFGTYPAAIRQKLLGVRALIFQTAAVTDGVGPLTETLKWGEAAYLTAVTKSGSTIRIGWKRSAPDRYAVYFHCRTRLVDRFRTLFADELSFEGNRAIVFAAADEIPDGPLARCIAMALRYHLDK